MNGGYELEEVHDFPFRLVNVAYFFRIAIQVKHNVSLICAQDGEQFSEVFNNKFKIPFPCPFDTCNSILNLKIYHYNGYDLNDDEMYAMTEHIYNDEMLEERVNDVEFNTEIGHLYNKLITTYIRIELYNSDYGINSTQTGNTLTNLMIMPNLNQ